MRTLSTTLRNAQQAQSIDALLKIVLTYGESSYTYTITRILDIEETEDGSLQSLKLMLDNSDKALNSLNLKGYKGVLSLGAVTGSGDEYSAFAHMWVKAQQSNSVPGKLVCTLSLEGICNLMADDKASETYMPDNDDEMTVKDLINEIISADIDCFSHCRTYDVVWDSEDDVIDDFKPKDKFRIYHGNNRLSAVNRLLDYTKCVMRAQSDGKIHIFNPITTGTDYNYTYSLESGHTFFSKASRERLVIPNYIKIDSEDDDDPQYNGSAIDTESHDRMPKREFYKMHLESDEQADKIAAAILAKAQMWSEAGSAEVPLNVGAEVFDYVKVTDEREDDYRVGNIGRLTRHYTAGKNVWKMTFTFGDWQNVRKALANLNLNSDDLENYFARLSVKDLYAENIVAKNCDFYWLDPDNTIDLTKIGDTIDNLQDGDHYARVKTIHLDAEGGIRLDENILYTEGFDPRTKEKGVSKGPTPPSDPATDDLWIDTSPVSPLPNIWKRWTGSQWVKATPGDLDEIGDGGVFARVKSSSLTTDGLVVLDEIYEDTAEGNYARVARTSVEAGKILLSQTKPDGDWYQESGVVISALTGMALYGEPGLMALRTYPTLADYLAGTNLQCYVGTDGKLYAGGGAVILHSTGITVKGETLFLAKSDGTVKGFLSAGASYVTLNAVEHHLKLTTQTAGYDILISTNSGTVDIYDDGHNKLRIPVGTDRFNS